MNMDKISHWLTLVANIGVLAGIIFLAVELRQSTNAQLATSRQQVLEADLLLINSLIEYPELLIGANKPDISEIELGRHTAYWIGMLRIREFAWFQYQNGVMDEATWQSYMRPVLNVFGQGRAREYLESGAFGGDPGFKAYVIQSVTENQ